MIPCWAFDISYAINWDAVSGGGGLASRAGCAVDGSAGRPSASRRRCSIPTLLADPPAL
jgi:hypothetical protein